MSDTPKTDKEEHYEIGEDQFCVVRAEFARDLERELAKANKNLESEIAGRIHFQWKIGELERENKALTADSKRLDWLADKNNKIGNVQLPRDIVVRNLTDMRRAIDEAMALAIF